MNICVFSVVTTWHGIKGGMEIHGRYLAEGLSHRGHDVTFISTKHPGGIEKEIRNGVEYHYLPNTTFGSMRKWWLKESIRFFNELHKRRPFDAVLCQQAVVPGIEKQGDVEDKIPVIVMLHGNEWRMLISELRQIFSHQAGYHLIPKHLLSFLYYALRYELPQLRGADAVITASRGLKEEVKRWARIPADKIYPIYNGIDVNVFQPSSTSLYRIREKHNISPKDKVIAFISQISRQKGIHLLVRAMRDILKSVSNAKLLIVGDGEYKSGTELLVKQLGLEGHVILTGFVAHERLPDYINCCDIYVLPTIRIEGFSFAIIEAMACEKPVIATDIGGNGEAIRDGVDGLLIRPGSVQEIVDKIFLLLRDEGKANSIAQQARKKVVNQFSLETMLDHYERVLEGAIRSKRHAG